MKRLRKTATFLALTLCVASFSACAPADQNKAHSSNGTAASGQTSQANDEAFTIGVASWMLKPGSPNADGYKAMIEKKYKEEYPNAKIDWSMSNAAEYFDTLKAKLASNSAPDIFFHQDRLALFGSGGYLMDLSDQPWVDDIMDATKPSCIYRGKVLAFPYDLGGWGIWYNKKIFKDLGVESAPKNFAEFSSICEKASKAGVDPIICGLKDTWMASGVILSFASFVYGQDKYIGKNIYEGKTKFNGPEFRSALDAMTSLIQKGYISKRCMSSTADQAMQIIGENKAAMMFNGPWCVSTVKDRYHTDLGFFEIPDEKGYNCSSAMANSVVSINAGTTQKERAQKLFDLIISEESLNTLDKDSGLSPLKTVEIKHETVGMQECGKVFSELDSTWQMNMWAPPAILEKLQQLSLKIVAGKGYTEEDLNNIDRAYQKDKGLLDPDMFNLLK